MRTSIAALKTGFRHYSTFRGRATRSEFWWWTLTITTATITFTAGAAIIQSATNTTTGTNTGYFLIIPVLFILATLPPTLSITARHLHDIGKSGWWQLAWYAAIPLLGALAIVLLFLAIAIAFATAGRQITAGPDWPAIIMAALLFSAAAAALVLPPLIVWATTWLTRPGDPGANCYGFDPRDTGLKGQLYRSRMIIKPAPTQNPQ